MREKILQTSNDWVNSLFDVALSKQGSLEDPHEVYDRLTFTLLAACSEEIGIVVADGNIGGEATIFFMNKTLWSEVAKYDTEEAYREALATDPEFMHPDDMERVIAHVTNWMPGPYLCRIKKQDGEYVLIEIVAISCKFCGNIYRISIICEAPEM